MFSGKTPSRYLQYQRQRCGLGEASKVREASKLTFPDNLRHLREIKANGKLDIRVYVFLEKNST